MNRLKRIPLAVVRPALIAGGRRLRGWAAWAILMLGGVTVTPSVAGSSIETLVLSVGGESTYTTYGAPPGFYPGLFFNSGVGIPSIGLAPAGVAGAFRIQDASAGPLSDSIALNTTYLSGYNSFAGSATANSQYGDVGAAAHAVFTGIVDPSIVQGAEGYGLYHETFTFNSPTAASGTIGWVQFHFTVDGTLSGKGSDVEINYQHNMPASTADYLLMRAGVPNSGASFLNTASGSIPSGFTVTPTSVGGSGVFDTVNLPIVYGTPFDFTFGMLAIATPSSGSTADVSFAMSALLTGIDLYNSSGQSVTDFSIISGSGTHYDANGVHLSAVPEPGSLTMALIGAGIASLYLASRRGLGASRSHCLPRRASASRRID